VRRWNAHFAAERRVHQDEGCRFSTLPRTRTEYWLPKLALIVQRDRVGRLQFDDETWEAIQALMRDGGNSFQELADEAFADLLKKRKQPVGLKAALKESVKKRGHKRVMLASAGLFFVRF
jgi:hypothetical protein